MAASRAGRSSPATARSSRPASTPTRWPIAIDELPLVALLGCFADGTTIVSGAGELRHKESDRIASVVDGLRRRRRRDRGDRRRLRRRRRGRPSRRDARFARRSPPRDARRRRGPRLARGGRGAGMDAAAVELPRLRGGPGLAGRRGASACWGVPVRARARGEAAGGRPRWRGPRGVRWDRTRPEQAGAAADLLGAVDLDRTRTRPPARRARAPGARRAARRPEARSRSPAPRPRSRAPPAGAARRRVPGSSRFAWLLGAGGPTLSSAAW